VCGGSDVRFVSSITSPSRCLGSDGSRRSSPQWRSIISVTSESALYAEVFELLEPGGVFANFQNVASPTHRLHLAFFAAIGEPLEHDDPSDRLLDVETQLSWLRPLPRRMTGPEDDLRPLSRNGLWLGLMRRDTN
jgi:hypothetical protein